MTDGGIYDGQFRIPKTPCRAKNELGAPHISEVLASKNFKKISNKIWRDIKRTNEMSYFVSIL